jgi:hypothetical protein
VIGAPCGTPPLHQAQLRQGDTAGSARSAAARGTSCGSPSAACAKAKIQAHSGVSGAPYRGFPAERRGGQGAKGELRQD